MEGSDCRGVTPLATGSWGLWTGKRIEQDVRVDHGVGGGAGGEVGQGLYRQPRLQASLQGEFHHLSGQFSVGKTV